MAVTMVICYQLTNSEMSVNGGIAGSSCQVFIFTIWNVLVSSSIPVFLGQPKIYDVDKIALLA